MEFTADDANGSTIWLSPPPFDDLRTHKDAETSRNPSAVVSCS